MTLVIKKILTKEQVSTIRGMLVDAPWIDGKVTAHGEAKKLKNNHQLIGAVEPLISINKIILERLRESSSVKNMILPVATIYPFVNRHGVGCKYGEHVDRPIRETPTKKIRCDISATIFLSEKDEYDGGELVITDGVKKHIKLDAGDMIVYPAYFIHEVKEVTRGVRYAACTWFQSMIRDRDKREVVSDMYRLIQSAALSNCDVGTQTLLSKNYQNLIRMFAEV